MASPQPDAYGLSKKGLTGVETFMLDFPSVPFPISLVLSDEALGHYQLLFRLLFFAKYVERRLVKIWQDHQAMKELNSVRGLFGPTFLLRQRMLHFAQNLIYYIMFEVIEPNWLEMEEAIGDPVTDQRRTVDDIVEIHDAFLNKTLAACLLTDKDLVRTLTKLMTTCLMFADQMKLFTEATRIVS
jgi:gamma-tubulin complex component 2